MANYQCPECGRDVYWTAPKGHFQTTNSRRLCDDCVEVIEAELAAKENKAIDESIDNDIAHQKHGL